MIKWFGAHYNQGVRFSSADECKKGSQVLTSRLNQRQNYYYTRICKKNCFSVHELNAQLAVNCIERDGKLRTLTPTP